MPKPYLDFSDYFRTHFSDKVQKISLNAGCTCPNRDGTAGVGGCTYCNNRSFSPEYTAKLKSIPEQMEEGIAFFARKYPHMKYLAYFQSYTNTYGDRERLRTMYEAALSQPNVVGLVVGTRPDCMDEELLRYFRALQKWTHVYIEYGVESTLGQTLERVNRGHTFADAQQTIRATAAYGLPCGAHLIIGLPGESREDYLHHITELNSLPITSIKLHQLQILRGTILGKEYRQAPSTFRLMTADEYLEIAIDLLRHMRPTLYVDRFVSQAPQDLILAPKWSIKNYIFTNKLVNTMLEQGYRQGDLYRESK